MKTNYMIAFACWIVICAGSAHGQEEDSNSLKKLTNSQLKEKLEEKERELKDLKALRSTVVGPTGSLAPTNFGQQNQRALPALATRDYVAGFTNFSTLIDRETMKANREIDREISELVAQIKKSDSDEEKQELKNEIQQLLEKQYEAYLDQHELPLRKLEERLEKLKSDLEARRKAKEDLVRLRLDSIWYQALDLRWPGGSGARTIWRNSDPFGSAPPLAAPFPTQVLSSGQSPQRPAAPATPARRDR